MTYSFTRKQIGLAVSCALALGFVSGATQAQSQMNPADTGYVADTRGTIVRSAYGLCWHNGTGPAPTTPMECSENGAPTPVTKAMEPAPQPVVIAAAPPQPAPAPQAAPKPASERVTLDADMLFDFDKAVLRPEGRAALDAFVGQTKDINPEVIMAVGHADRFGSDQYNQRLSEERVAAVRSYLLSKGIASDRLHTEGKGESQPVTKAGECDGAKSAKVIACLQPDRRVEVEVVGTRIAR